MAAAPSDDEPMDRKRLVSIVAGGLLILLGIMVLVFRLFAIDIPVISWPLLILGTGIVFLFVGVRGDTALAGLVIPGVILSGIGGILYWQNLTDRWFSWAYVWTLIPGFVGLGLLLFDLLSGPNRRVRIAVRWLLSVSGGLFLIFTTFLSPISWFWIVLGIGLISVGVLVILRSRQKRAG
jgi:hypothetical protein